MEYRYSRKARREISTLGFGGWQLGNASFWGDMSREDAVNLVKEAVNRGVNFFDTAPGYSNGLSERIIGEGIKGKRDKVFLNTKFGHNADGTSDFSIERIEPSIRESMERIGTTYIDSVILHNPEFYILEGKTKHFEELQRLKKTGLIKAYGVSIDTKEELKAVLDNLDVDVIELMFNIVHQEVTEYFDIIEERGILLVIKVPLDSGWLTGKYDKDSMFTGIRGRWNQETKNTRSKIVSKIKEIVQDEDIVKHALAFILEYEAVISVIPGVKSIDQLLSNKKAVKYKLDAGVKDKLNELYESFIKNQDTPW